MDSIKTAKSLNRRCRRHAGHVLGGARRRRAPDELLRLCRVLTRYLRLARRMEKRDPHLFGPRARDYYLDTPALERQQQETEAALNKLYGPPHPSQPTRNARMRAVGTPDNLPGPFGRPHADFIPILDRFLPLCRGSP